MTCQYVNIGNTRAIICSNTGIYRLPLSDGTRVYMDWHDYLGPIFFKDKSCLREIEDWYENQLICDALDWFQKRGNKA